MKNLYLSRVLPDINEVRVDSIGDSVNQYKLTSFFSSEVF